MDKEKNIKLAEWVIDFAKKNGASDAIVSLYNYEGTDIQVLDQKIEKLQQSIQSGINIKIFTEGKYSSNSTNRLKKSDLESFIKDAINSTKYLSKDEFRKLPEKEWLYKGGEKDLKVFDESFEKVDPQQKINLALQVEAETKGMDPRIINVKGNYGDGSTKSILLTSNGFEGFKQSTNFSVSASASVKGETSRPEDYDYVSGIYFKDIKAAGLGKNAVNRAIQKIDSKKIKSGKFTMLVENRIADKLVSPIIEAISGYSLQQKQSFLEDMIGKQIASDKLTIIDNPFIPSGLGSKLYDSEGLETKVMPVIEKGILKTYYLDTYYARKMKLQPTTGDTTNLQLTLGNKNLQELLKSLKNGIYVTSFNGGNSNSVTGDFSYGIDGFLIKNGKIEHAISEMNVSGNYKDFWKRLVEVGNDPTVNSSWLLPSLIIDGVDFSGL